MVLMELCSAAARRKPRAWVGRPHSSSSLIGARGAFQIWNGMEQFTSLSQGENAKQAGIDWAGWGDWAAHTA